MKRRPRANLKSWGYLHIGSTGGPDVAKSQFFSGNKKNYGAPLHTLVDPLIRPKSSPHDPEGYGKEIRESYPKFEFVQGEAEYIVDALLHRRRRYHTVKMDMPYEELLRDKIKFSALCRKLRTLLVPNGNIVLLTENKPDEPAKFLEKTPQGLKQTTGVTIQQALQKEGFRVNWHQTQNQETINRSETASKAVRLHNEKGMTPIFYQIIATKLAKK